jgi:hypothetical protein
MMILNLSSSLINSRNPSITLGLLKNQDINGVNSIPDKIGKMPVNTGILNASYRQIPKGLGELPPSRNSPL